ncbi:MAG: S8 family peptidase [Pseudomonadota bacterium]
MAKRARNSNGSSGGNPENGNVSGRELVVKMQGDAQFRSSLNTGPTALAADAAPFAELLSNFGAEIEPLFGLPEERMRSIATAAGPSVAEGEMETYYAVTAPDKKLDELAEAILDQSKLVEAAYVKPQSTEPVGLAESDDDTINEMMPLAGDGPPASPDFTASQIYLNPAPAGIDARYAWSIAGGRGAGVKIIDCEWGWNFSHEDLLQKQIGVVFGGNSSNNNHGTAVLGEYSADVNTFGVTGICSDAIAGASSFVNTPSTARTIREAADRLSAGDIILLEIHRAGPNATGSGQFGYIAVEWWPDDFAAIRYAVNKGIIVVEAAGNGSQNLDAAVYNTRPANFPASWRNPFNPANPSSHAVLVGAGAPPPGTHGRNHGADRSRLGFSNYGKRVDCQGWGREVTTAGYGNLQGGNRNIWYTETFSGTSSASPIVVGALGCVQGILKAQGSPVLTPTGAINLLRTTGSPQQDTPGRPKTQRIGNRPNLRQMIPAAAKTWRNNVSVTRVYATYHSKNAWAAISGMGWRKIETGSDDGVTNMLMLLTEACASGQRVDVYADGSKLYRAVQR